MKHRARNVFLALVCLLLFAAIGAALYTNWASRKPFAVIVFLTEGLTPAILTPARLHAGGADHQLAMERLHHLALMRNHSADFATPDAAAAAAALATGRKIRNGHLSVDETGRVLPTWADLARAAGRSVGIVSNTSVLSPTLAAFLAPGADPGNPDQIGNLLLDRAPADVILGGGRAALLPELKGGTRKDDRDLLLEARREGFDLVRNLSELESIPAWRPPKLLGLFADGDFAFAGKIHSAGPQPSLADMVRRAIQLLQYNRSGYLLIVEAGLVGQACRANDGEQLLHELAELDKAVETALAYAGDRAVIIVAGTRSTGGFHLSGRPFRTSQGGALLGRTPQGIPAVTWSTGPGGGLAAADPETDEHPLPLEPSAVITREAAPIVEDMLLLSSGEGTEELRGFLDNTDVFEVLRGKF